MHNQIPMQVAHTADPAGNHLCKKTICVKGVHEAVWKRDTWVRKGPLNPDSTMPTIKIKTHFLIRLYTLFFSNPFERRNALILSKNKIRLHFLVFI